MTGYKLSRQAAEAYNRRAVWTGPRAETKAIVSLDNGMAEWAGVSRQDGVNFRTNQVSLAQHQDATPGGNSGALGLSATWACVNLLAGTIASLPLVVYRKGPLGVAVEATDHPLYWLLHDSPNYDQSAYDFWEFICAGLELHGNAYAVLDRRSDGFLVSLTPIRPDIVAVRRIRTGQLEYRWTIDGREAVKLQEDILHIRGFGGSPLGGASPLSACRQVFGAALNTDRSASSMFANGVQTSGVFAMQEKLTEDQMRQAEQKVTEKYVGAANAGRPLVLNGGVKWEQISISPEDAQMLESRKFSVEEICRVFDVPPHLIGHTEGNTQLGSSIGEQTLGFLKFKLRKRLKRIEGALEKQLLTRADRAAGVSIEFNVEGLLRADSAGRAQYYEIMQQFMTKNEIRALEGLAPVEGGDVLMAQMQDVPLSEALKARTAPGAVE
jgi:HK97 family phage portal protein